MNGSASDAYERYIVQAFMQWWTHALLEMAALAAGARVLNIATPALTRCGPTD